MQKLLQKLALITIFQSGPEDIESGAQPLKLSLFMLILVNILSIVVYEANFLLIMTSLLQVIVIALMTHLFLTSKGFENRFYQTLAAILGCNALLNFALLVLSFILGKPDMLPTVNVETGELSEPLSTFQLLSVITGLWIFAIHAHILKNALEVKFLMGLLYSFITSLVIFVVVMFIG